MAGTPCPVCRERVPITGPYNFVVHILEEHPSSAAARLLRVALGDTKRVAVVLVTLAALLLATPLVTEALRGGGELAPRPSTPVEAEAYAPVADPPLASLDATERPVEASEEPPNARTPDSEPPVPEGTEGPATEEPPANPSPAADDVTQPVEQVVEAVEPVVEVVEDVLEPITDALNTPDGLDSD